MLLVEVALGIGYVCDHLEYHIIEGLSVLGGMCSFRGALTSHSSLLLLLVHYAV